MKKKLPLFRERTQGFWEKLKSKIERLRIWKQTLQSQKTRLLKKRSLQKERRQNLMKKSLLKKDKSPKNKILKRAKMGRMN